jgi:hypothetical protein
VTGTLPVWLPDDLPEGMVPLSLALGLFLAGTALLTLGVYLIVALLVSVARWRRPSVDQPGGA